MSNELTTTGGNALNFSDKELLHTVQATICPDATPEEFKMFVEFCKGTGLNPFKKEIWFIKTKSYTKKDGTKVDGKVQMMTGIAGFYAIANSHPQYDGMEEVCIERQGNTIIRATAKVWRKDRKFPSVGVAEWAEYAPEKTQWNGNSIWFTKPTLMISKVAESIALRKAFPNELNGLYTQEEMPTEFAPKEPLNVTPKPEAPKMLAGVKPADEIVKRSHWYFIPNATPEQELWLNDKGCKKHGATGMWESPKNLGKKFEAFVADAPDESVDVSTGEITSKPNNLWADTPSFLK